MVPFTTLTDAVGPGKPNRPVDVAIVQDLLSFALKGTAGDCIDGIADDALFKAIAEFGKTLSRSASHTLSILPGSPAFLQLMAKAGPNYAGPRIFLQSPVGSWKLLDRTRFYELYRLQFRRLLQAPWAMSSPPGLEDLTPRILADIYIDDLRWMAYMIATVQRETRVLQPVEEGGLGKGKTYGQPNPYTDHEGRKHNEVYFGRGYVQLTHLKNYIELSDEIYYSVQPIEHGRRRKDDTLAIKPKLALDQDVAYHVMSQGMRHGSFTGVSLRRYIGGTQCDYRGARAIINGSDMAREIAACAQMCEGLLWLATRACFGTSILTGAAVR